MMKLQMSAAASALLRLLIARSGAERDRILLTDAQSIEWRSLTFDGERHHLAFRITGKDAAAVAERMCDGLAEAEFVIPGMFVADVGLVGVPERRAGGAVELLIEALTIAAD